MRPTFKGIRAGYKNSSYVVTLHDSSYYEAIKLHGSFDEFENLFSLIAPLTNLKQSNSVSREYSCFIYHLETYPRGLIGKISFLWEDNENIILWIHPSIYNTIFQHLKQVIESKNLNILCETKQGDFVRYELMGPRSHALLQSILKFPENMDKNQSGEYTWERLKGLRSCGELSKGTILSLIVNNPQLTFPPPAAKISLASKEPQTQKELEELALLLANETIPSSSKLWKSNFDATNCNTNIPIVLIQRPGGDFSYSPPFDELNQRNKQISSGWDIIVPKHCGMFFWKSLVFAGARVIGLNTRTSMELESGKLSFPSDYIDTEAYQSKHLEKMSLAKQIYQKKPPSKRVNYIKINSTYPWELNWKSLINHWGDYTNIINKYSSLISTENRSTLENFMKTDDESYFIIRDSPKQISDWLYTDDFSKIPKDVIQFGFIAIRIFMTCRGTPNANGFVCFPTNDDFDKLKEISNTPPLLSQENIMHKISSRPGEDIPFTFNTSRDVIGFITSGGHTYSDGKGSAIAVCSFMGLLLLRCFYDQRLGLNYLKDLLV